MAWWHVEVGKVRGGQPQIEGARLGDLDGAFHRPGPTGETARLFRRAPQPGERGGGKPAVDLVKGAARPDRGQRGGEWALRARRVVDVVGRDDLDPGAGGNLGQGVVAVTVDRIAVIPQLDKDSVTSEPLDEAIQRSARRGGSVSEQRPGHGPLATAREHPPRLVRTVGSTTGEVDPGPGGVGETGERERRCPFLSGQLAGADRSGQAGVSSRSLRQHHEMLAGRVGDPVGGPGGPEGELGAEDGGQPDRARRLGETDDAVEAVVVGDREGREPQTGGLVHQLLGVARPVQEGEIGVTVQLRVTHLGLRRRARHRIEHVFARQPWLWPCGRPHRRCREPS